MGNRPILCNAKFKLNIIKGQVLSQGLGVELGVYNPSDTQTKIFFKSEFLLSLAR